MGKVAVITGVTGQDGSYLAEFLCKKDYKVIGLARRSSVNTHERLNKVSDKQNFMLLESDLTDPSSINHIVNRYKPDEVYNLAAQSHVQTSFSQPVTTFSINTVGVLTFLDAIKTFSPHTKFYQASTSEMFGSNFSAKLQHDGKEYKYQDEGTQFAPNSPYAVAKLAAHQLVGLYRKSYNVFGACGILFNHESERRGDQFVTRKITKYVGDLHAWKKSKEGFKGILTDCHVDYPKLKLGNLDAYRDWGYAPDYVEAMWMILQHNKPDDFVIGTGETHSVREFVQESFKVIGIKDWEKYVEIDSQFYRPCEVEFLCGSSRKAKEKLGWSAKTNFESLVRKMVQYDTEETQSN